MKNRLPFILVVLLLGGLLGGLPTAQASHLLGGDLTYTSLGGNQYLVKFRLYRDCTGITPSSFTLECRNGGCGSATAVTATLLQQGAVTAGNPFCAAVSSGPCQGPTGLPNYDVYTYQATVTLVPGNWILSTSQNARPTLANVANAGDLFVQATLDNRASPTGAAVTNNSPQFDPQDIPIQYVCVNQPTTITYSSIEADGDSVVYSLTAPLESCGVPVDYAPYPGAGPGGVTIIRNNPLCVYQAPFSGIFSPTLPLPVSIDTVGICPLKTGVPRFAFNQQARTISFTPNLYIPNTASNLGRNKYQVAVLLTEYRRINGVRRVIGTVRREANLIVTDCGGNTVPNPATTASQTPNAGTTAINTADTTQINVYSCSYSRVQLSFTDPDNTRTPSANQRLTVTLPADINTNPNLLDTGEIGSFVLNGNSTPNPRGTFFFQPSPAAVGRIIRLSLRIEDDACPIKGIQNRVVIIKVLRGNFATALATGTGSSTPAICAGTSLNLSGTVLRPDSVRRFAASTTVLQTYGFQWSLVSGNGLNAATATQPNITVTPTVTSRYRLQTTPLSGYGPGCGDTTSVVVRVLPAVAAPTITRSGNTLTSSYPSGNQWYLNSQPLPGATGPSLVATTNGAYTVQTLVAGTLGSCLSPVSAAQAVVVTATSRTLPGTSFSVLPNPTPDGRFNVVLTGYHQLVELTIFDALGRSVGRVQIPKSGAQVTSQPLDLTSLRAGLYILQVRTASSLETRRVVRE